jgi:DNA uptake protein ComE-like DNA-binding protein
MRIFSTLAILAALAAPAFAQAPAAQPVQPKAHVTAPSSPAPAPAARPVAAPAAALLDVNSATEAQLATLKGIGPVRAKAIVAGRPYKGKDDIVAKAGVPQTVYDAIKSQIIAKQK